MTPTELLNTKFVQERIFLEVDRFITRYILDTSRAELLTALFQYIDYSTLEELLTDLLTDIDKFEEPKIPIPKELLLELLPQLYQESYIRKRKEQIQREADYIKSLEAPTTSTKGSRRAAKQLRKTTPLIDTSELDL